MHGGAGEQAGRAVPLVDHLLAQFLGRAGAALPPSLLSLHPVLGAQCLFVGWFRATIAPYGHGHGAS